MSWCPAAACFAILSASLFPMEIVFVFAVCTAHLQTASFDRAFMACKRSSNSCARVTVLPVEVFILLRSNCMKKIEKCAESVLAVSVDSKVFSLG